MTTQAPAVVTSDTVAEAPEIKEEWKRHAWKQKTALRLIRTSTEMVKLFTNNGTEQLLVHKNLLCHFSLYHYRLLNGPFLEGTYPSDKPIAVDTSLRVFNLFFTWLYSGTVDECPKGENGHMWDENMVDLYVLADSFNCTALQRTIISTQPSLQPNSTHLPCFTTLARLADKYLALAPLYQYFLDAYAQHWNGIWKISNSTSIEVVDPMPENFAFVALSRALQHKTEPCKCCQGRCAYHGHERKKNATPATCESPDDAFEDDKNELTKKRKSGEGENTSDAKRSKVDDV